MFRKAKKHEAQTQNGELQMKLTPLLVQPEGLAQRKPAAILLHSSTAVTMISKKPLKVRKSSLILTHLIT